MLKERASFTQGFLRPTKGTDEMMKVRNSNFTRDTKFSGTMVASDAGPKPQVLAAPEMGLSDTGSSNNTEAMTGRLRTNGGGFQMGHSHEETIRKPIDESVLRRMMDGRLRARKNSFDTYAFGPIK
jgi:hypothetical protein